MARETFDFDAVNLTDGGFYHSAGNAQGTMMVGFGRGGRNKWVQLSQPEISNFLAHGHSMLRTDDPILKGMLTDLARYLAKSAPLTLERVSALAQTDPAIGPRFAKLVTTGTIESALEVLHGELAEAGKL
jgi:hypothetical protein